MKNIGLNIEQPTTDCDDHHCPFHGQISIRGKLIQAKLIKTKARRTAVVRIEFFHYVKKYMRKSSILRKLCKKMVFTMKTCKNFFVFFVIFLKVQLNHTNIM